MHKVITIEDHTLLDRVRTGEKKSLETLFNKYYVQLCRYALKFVKRRDISEEIVQELFIDFWKKRESLPDIYSIRSYLHMSVKNRSLNFLKSADSKYQPMEEFVYDTALETTEEYMNVSELELIVAAAIEKLPSKCKTIFVLNRHEGMTYKLIAEELNISIKTVETQMAIALKRVKEHVEDNWGKILILLLSVLFYILVSSKTIN